MVIKTCPIHKSRQLGSNGFCQDCSDFPINIWLNDILLVEYKKDRKSKLRLEDIREIFKK